MYNCPKYVFFEKESGFSFGIYKMNEFKMIDIGEKNITKRTAVAQGRISMAPETFCKIKERKMPKGDVLAMAEVAGIMAAKRTSDILPLCHPLLLDSIRINCELEEDRASVLVLCEVITHSKTGVEMEALTGVSAALLSIYDLTKIVDPVLTISDVLLRSKEGGKSGIWHHPKHDPDLKVRVSEIQQERTQQDERWGPAGNLAGIRACVLTVSDRCSRGKVQGKVQGEAKDTSGPAIAEFLIKRGSLLTDSVIVADEISEIQAEIRRFTENQRADLIIITGGTGLGPLDVTPEALSSLWTKPIPGIGELLRSRGATHTKLAWLSRSEAGLIGSALVILLPGSPKAVNEGMVELEELLSHAIQIAKGGSHS